MAWVRYQSGDIPAIDAGMPMNLLLAVTIGFLLGLRHAVDADHVVAVTTIVGRERSFRRAASIGAWWGIGHSLALWVVGGAIVAFRLVVPPRAALSLELGVAAMLIGLGFRSLLRGSAAGSGDRSESPPGRARQPFLIGVVHGLAGSAAVALLVLTTIPTVLGGLAYLGVFGVGTIAGMMVVTALLAAPAALAATRAKRFERGMGLAAGVLSVALGVLLAWEIVAGGGLFSAAPRWTPR